MNAKQAFDLTKRAQFEQEKIHLPYIINYQSHVEAAAKAGKRGCSIGVIPMDSLDFVSNYFEEMGYFVVAQAVQGGVAVALNWGILPTASRAFVASGMEYAEIDAFLEKI
jgi:hypothetical protein